MANLNKFHSLRRFGIEIELNTTSGEIKDLGEYEVPEGSHHIASIVSEVTRMDVEIHPWHHTHNNTCWVIKPDRSCGIELCSPILKGWTGLQSVLKVVESLQAHGISADHRCSFHMHANIGDLSMTQQGSIIGHYIKCEPTFFEAMPIHRRYNRYCQCVGMSDLFNHSIVPNSSTLLRRLSTTKYHSINAYHMRKNKRRTIEFRIGDNGMCLDAYAVKNWVRLLLHFIEIASRQSLPPRYQYGDKWTGLVWLDPEDVLKFLKLDGDRLSLGMRQVREWFVGRLLEFRSTEECPAVWSINARNYTLEGLERYLDNPVEKSLYHPNFVS